MPRLTYRQLRRAQALNPLLPLVLRGCRDLSDAQNEFRWLREFVQQQEPVQPLQTQRLKQLCTRRSKGIPLQYLLGNQPFGELDILCRPEVLIPRPETESYTTFLSRCLRLSCSTQSRSSLRVLDLCTGTGCISLLLHSLLADHYNNLHIQGVDISGSALSLAKQNLRHNVDSSFLKKNALSQVTFSHGDVLSKEYTHGEQEWDVLVSNPPYISQSSFNKDTTRSTRNYEPRLALVPQVNAPAAATGVDLTGDIFYHKIVDIAQSAKAKVVVMEIADDEQARRVIGRVDQEQWQPSIWHDNLYNAPPLVLFDSTTTISDGGRVGTGKARAVVFTSK